MIEFLLLDLDDTILDFHKAERIALSKTIQDFGVEPTEEALALYHKINKWHWEQLELGVMTREEVLTGRFAVFFRELGKEVDPTACARAYERNLSIGHYFLPGAEETVQALSKKYRLFLVSNGTATVQHSRLTSAGLYPYFEQVFVSQEIGFNKPDKAYLDRCFERISGFAPEKALMVGDSLTSDIKGGINAGDRTVWVNPKHKDCGDIRPDYQLDALSQLPELLEEL